MHTRALVTASALALAAALAAPAANALQINDLFDSSISSDANAAQIEATIEASTNQIAATYGDHTKVTILFKQAPGQFLGETENTIYSWDTADYNGFSALDALSHPDNAPLWQGLTTVLSQNVYPSNNLLVSGADLRSLGLTGVRGAFDKSGNFTPNGGDVDAVITLTTTVPINYSGVMPAYDGTNLQYNAQNIIQHEVDEVLGGGGAGSTLNDVYFLKHGGTFGDPATDAFVLSAIGPLDRFRYHAPGDLSFMTGTGANSQSYFSLDGGVTDLVDFNQFHQGDYGDFGPTTTPCSGGGHGGPGNIQDAFGCNNEQTLGFTKGNIEDVMLQSIGWDHSVVPEPAGWAMMIFGLGAVGSLLRRRPRPSAA